MFRAKLVATDRKSIANTDETSLHGMDSNPFVTSINGPHGNLALVPCDDVMCLFRYTSSYSSSSSNSQKQGLELIFRAKGRKDYNSWNVGVALSDRSEDECFVAFEHNEGSAYKKSSVSVFNVACLLNIDSETLEATPVHARLRSSAVQKVSVLYDKSQRDSVFGCVFSKTRPDELVVCYRSNKNSKGIFWNFKKGEPIFNSAKPDCTFQSFEPESENFTGVIYSGADEKHLLISESNGSGLTVIDCKTNKAIRCRHELTSQLVGSATISSSQHSAVVFPSAYTEEPIYVLENEYPFNLKFKISGGDISAAHHNKKTKIRCSPAPHPFSKNLVAVGTYEGLVALVTRSSNPENSNSPRILFTVDLNELYASSSSKEKQEEGDEKQDEEQEEQGDKTKRCFALRFISESALLIVLRANYNAVRRQVCVINIVDPFYSRKIVFQIARKGKGEMSKLFSSEYAPKFLVSKYLPLCFSVDF